ncbi:phytanoyl-CoA dioxygenase family protein [Dictyobacter formicarum]|nr:phytanoyl-CoA dioxygenase family protein [Dictyobacter formicarum]
MDSRRSQDTSSPGRKAERVAGENIRLTPAQRLHFDVYGYVLLENVLTTDEVTRMKQALYRLKAEPDLDAHRVYVNKQAEHMFHVGHVVEYDPALLDYASHPRLIPLVKEIVGGAIRLEETEAIINRRDPLLDPSTYEHRRTLPTGFHTGTRYGWGTYMANHHFHCLFVKTLAYLTDVGPDDGGTAVIPGSHRLGWNERDIIDAALTDERLIHQVEAKAGSVLLFAESLVHSTTAVRSDRERVVLISGYTPPMMREWPGNEISPAFVATLPEEIRPLISGSESWHWRHEANA